MPREDRHPASEEAEEFLAANRRKSEAVSVHDCRHEATLDAYSDTQWYCPPDVGAQDAISDRLAMTGRNPTKVQTVPQRVPARPPSMRPSALELQTAVSISQDCVIESLTLTSTPKSIGLR